ncbi:MAG: hypothetical protein ABW165_07895, partial [Candidatus Thiodiazotropha sp.]
MRPQAEFSGKDIRQLSNILAFRTGEKSSLARYHIENAGEIHNDKGVLDSFADDFLSDATPAGHNFAGSITGLEIVTPLTDYG